MLRFSTSRKIVLLYIQLIKHQLKIKRYDANFRINVPISGHFQNIYLGALQLHTHKPRIGIKEFALLISTIKTYVHKVQGSVQHLGRSYRERVNLNSIRDRCRI